MEFNTDLFKIKSNHIKPQKGSLLVSEPFSPDGMFRRAVVLLTQHGSESSAGFILNKPANKTLSQVSSEFGNFEAPVYYGGPVSQDTLFYFHCLGDKIPGSIPVAGDIAWGGDFDIIKMMIEAGTLKPEHIRFFIGYSGWEADQLNTEIKKDFWLVTNTENENIMKPDKNIWTTAVETLDKRYRIWQHFPENPLHN